MNTKLAKRLADLEEAAQRDSDPAEPASLKPPFDYEKYRQQFDAMFVTHTRVAIDTPREQVRERVADWITRLEQSVARYTDFEPEGNLEVRIDAETDRVMALTAEELSAACATAHC